MIECSSCGEQFESVSDFDIHVTGSCRPVDENGVVRHPVPVSESQSTPEPVEEPEPEPAPAERVTEVRGNKETEISKAPERETRG